MVKQLAGLFSGSQRVLLAGKKFKSSLLFGFLCLGASLGVAAQDEQAEVRQDACALDEASETPLRADYRRYAGKTIASIRFNAKDVFDTSDPRENNTLYRFFNWLHINTRPSVIAPQLLFKPGDPLDVDILAESERLLRKRPYLGDAYIQVDADCGDSVALLVVTRDIWTLEPQVSVGREGGENQHGFGFSEENLFGTGTALTIGYDKDRDRSSTSIGLYTPHLFNSRFAAKLGFADTSDGQQTQLAFEQPFYSVQTVWAMGTTHWDLTQEETIRYRDQEINEYKLQEQYHETYLGWAFDRHNTHAQRLWFGITQDRQVFRPVEDTQGELPPNENLKYVWLQYQYVENQFAVYRNLYLLHQTEDIATGKDLKLRLGHGGGWLGNDEDFVQYDLSYSDLLGVGDQHLLQFQAYATGRYYDSSAMPDERLWGGDIGYHYLMGDKNRWYIQLRYDQGHQLAEHRELTTGGGYDMRGYPVDYQRGDRRYVFRIERRYISNIHLFNLLRMGGVVYLDAGRARGAGYSEATHLSNVGIGLRLGSSKAKTGKVLHMDLAFPLADKQYVDKFQWVITASSQF
jgi:hypothetical protein